MPVLKSIPAFLSEQLNSLIKSAPMRRDIFVKNPQDFTRKRRLPLRLCIYAMFRLDNNQLCNALRHALPDCMKENMPTVSAATQQLDKLKLTGFKYIFNEMVKLMKKYIKRKLLRGIYTLACADGSDFPVPEDTLSNIDDDSMSEADREKAKEELKKKHKNTQRMVQRRKLHVNAVLDVLNHLYLAVDMRPKLTCNERIALIDVLESFRESNPDMVPQNMIMMCDRGYESYHLFAWLCLTGFKFIIRVKAPSSKGILKNPKYGIENDCVVDKTITICVKQNEKGQYEKADSEKDGVTQRIKLRVVSKKLKDGTWGYWITNLRAPGTGKKSPEQFSRRDIISLYTKRWIIETSFRYLKYGVGAICFHSRKLERQKMEVYVAMTLLNCIMTIVSHTRVTDRRSTNKYRYKINITAAVEICMDFLLNEIYTPQTLRRELLKNLVKYEPGRYFPRKVNHDDKTVIFFYRPR